ncbi:hypothetical protein P4V43_20485 [Brevibacillus fortis]|uniref:hypothetical protein n=1 Tax=Brevibacillus fortis TaxID=2126352 RepID=UPI002E22B6B4|nr:hypothetical protein [Brevibacillus fortis]
MSELQTLASTILHITRELEKSILREESEPETWNELLEKRQQVMDQIDLLLEKGGNLEASALQNLQEAFAVDQKLYPLMNKERNSIEEKMKELNQIKVASNRYNNLSNLSGYGAFFDTKN